MCWKKLKENQFISRVRRIDFPCAGWGDRASRGTILASFAVAIMSNWLICTGALAASSNKASKTERELPRREFSSGIDYTPHSWFAYTSIVWAPGEGLDRTGLRLRAMAGHGRYDYDSQRAVAGSLVATEFSGNVSLGELMAGYAWESGALWLKSYVGVSYADHRLTPDDPQNEIKGAKFGVKGQIEAWLRVTRRSWLSADASLSSPFSDYWAQMRFGTDIGRIVTIGPEAALLGNREFSAERAGGFMRFRFGKSQLTLSGGLSGNFKESGSFYAGTEFYRRY